MQSQMIHCPVLKREVEVLLTRTPHAHPSEPLARSLCIAVERRCTGPSCPLCTVSPGVMRDEMERMAAVCAR